MNFKITKGKAIVSIVIPVILWILIITIGRTLSSIQSGIIMRFLQIHNLNNLFSFGNISLFIIEVIIIYLILSIFQKKKIVITSIQ